MASRSQLAVLGSTALAGVAIAVAGLVAGDYDELSNALYGGALVAGLAAAVATIGAAVARRDRLARSYCTASHLADVVRKLSDEQDVESRSRDAAAELAEARVDLKLLLDSGECTRAAELRTAIEQLEALAGTQDRP